MFAVQTSLDGERIAAAGVEHVIACRREPDGNRYDYGTGLAIAWTARPGLDVEGVLVIEHDVLVDPDDMACMDHAISQNPKDVVAAPYVCWPASTALDHPMTLPRFNHGLHVFGLGCTWIPARLMASVWSSLHKTDWATLDNLFSRGAADLGLTVRMPTGTSVKHAHF